METILNCNISDSLRRLTADWILSAEHLHCACLVPRLLSFTQCADELWCAFIVTEQTSATYRVYWWICWPHTEQYGSPFINIHLVVRTKNRSRSSTIVQCTLFVGLLLVLSSLTVLRLAWSSAGTGSHFVFTLSPSCKKFRSLFC